MDFSLLRRFSACRRGTARALCACAIAVVAAGCGTTIEDAVPGARRTGAYPNLNIPPEAAANQLTDEEAEAGIAAVAAARRAQQAAGAGKSESEAERLVRLRESHGDQALEEIER